MSSKKIKAPFAPKIGHELDVSNFAEEFTHMAATDSPAVVPMNGEKLFKVGGQLCDTIMNGLKNDVPRDVIAI